MNAKTIRIIAVLSLSLGACGQTADLSPETGKPLPPKPAMATKTPTANDLLTPPPYARPQRVDELQKRGEAREPDPFDLAPPAGATIPSKKDQPATQQQDSAPQ